MHVAGNASAFPAWLARRGRRRLRLTLCPLACCGRRSPRPRASNSGKAKTQNRTSGSRFNSRMRAARSWAKPDQRPFCGGCFGVDAGFVLSWPFRFVFNFFNNSGRYSVLCCPFPVLSYVSRKCLPVRATNTSSRLACRVVSCSSLITVFSYCFK